jgi:hypothetical protein
MNTARVVTLVLAAVSCAALVGCSSSPDAPTPADAGDAADAPAAAPTSSFGDAGKVVHAPCDPLAPPAVGAACEGIGTCSVPVGGCGRAIFECKTGSWSAVAPAPSCGDCPAQRPTDGAACNLAISCAYAATSTSPGEQTCALDHADCSELDETWHVSHQNCSASCPVAEAAAGSPCDGNAFCIWAASSHGIDVGRCKNGTWNITPGG